MKNQAKAASVPVEEPALPINAKFQRRLPDIVNEISQQLMVIEPAIRELSVPLREFLDYLDFEISKLELDIKQKRWEAVVDVEEIKSEEAWLAKLKALRSDFNIDVMTSPAATVRSMLDRVRQTFMT
ncbi:hypothetical protein J4G48_0040690 [Bradyrhizobium barranii subsp. apii]|uniref:hypothetical protein n=1 Tax=Bradyrhizobium barranii TaxID=2992140 RepID=UPI001AA0BEFC|nr:hypothetical protein [Bradyrhizobium barranii]UPT95475.1 hypothetical protein J4G48_0040690 [Bradyrhizobium barranii subsp. apii]